jgi:hypothetical protein
VIPLLRVPVERAPTPTLPRKREREQISRDNFDAVLADVVDALNREEA